jgi:hypothetical protein
MLRCTRILVIHKGLECLYEYNWVMMSSVSCLDMFVCLYFLKVWKACI